MIGYVAAILSALFQTSKDLVSKKLAFSVDGATSAFASFVFALPFYLVCMAVLSAWGIRWWEYSGDFVLYIFLRALVDTIAETLKMYSFAYADISLLVCIFALSPLLLLFLSPLVTGDPLRSHHVVAIVCIVAGSLVLGAKSGLGTLRMQKKGVLIASISAIFFALNTCLDRLAAQHSSAVLSGFGMTIISALFVLPLMFSGNRLHSLGGNSRGFLWRGFFEAGFMISRLWALQYYSAPFVISIQKISIILSIIGGRVAFNEKDTSRRLIAGALVLVGVAYALINE